MAEILIADDERVLREGLKAMLLGEGHAVRTARDGEDALRKISERAPDLILLDVMMPKMNGFKTCEEIRKADRAVPVIFLTAKDSEADQVRGLGLGADDYVSKDAGETLLLARINRALARRASLSEIATKSGTRLIRLGRIRVDMKTLVVSGPNEEIARLTKTESDILRLLDSARGVFFSTEQIISELRGQGFSCTDSMLYSHMSNLRHKLGASGALISCNRNAGYCLAR